MFRVTNAFQQVNNKFEASEGVPSRVLIVINLYTCKNKLRGFLFFRKKIKIKSIHLMCLHCTGKSANQATRNAGITGNCRWDLTVVQRSICYQGMWNNWRIVKIKLLEAILVSKPGPYWSYRRILRQIIGKNNLNLLYSCK